MMYIIFHLIAACPVENLYIKLTPGALLDQFRAFCRPALGVCLFLGLTTVGVPTSAQAALVVDDFTVGPVSLSVNGDDQSSDEQTGLDPANVLGGSRLASVSTVNVNPTPSTLDIDPTAGSGRFQFAGSESNADSATGFFRLNYTADESVDLTQSGSAFVFNGVRFSRGNDLSLSAGGYGLTLTVTDASEEVGRFSVDFRPSNLPYDIEVLFSSLPSFFSEVDLSQIDMIDLYASTPGNTTLSFDRLAVIPEPTSIGLFGLGLGAIVLGGRRRPE